jgi:nondiscriminating glutamyl-tRNA synthetase
VLRIEDTDAARSLVEFEESIMADLRWLGLDWDEGPDTGGDHGPYRQSERSAQGIYRNAAERLLSEGKAYHCFCSQDRLQQLKEETLARGQMPRYDRRCASLPVDEAAARVAQGEPATIRFQVPTHEIVVNDVIHGPTKFSSDVLGDFIIIRSDGGVSYNFAVVVDDIAMEITHVIRGEDHLTNTARQLLVFEAFGHEPPAYAHHSLVMGPDGGKLSKRHGATSVGDFRDMGYLSSAIINYLALLSWSPGDGEEKMSKTEMEQQFELHRVSKSPAIFDIQKLNWLDGLHIRDLSPDELDRALKPFLAEIELDIMPGQLAVAEAAVQTGLVTLADSTAMIRDFFDMVPLEKAADAAEITDGQAKAVLEMALARIESIPMAADIAAERVQEGMDAARALVKELKKGCKADEIPPKRLFRTLRIALTGKTSGPELPFLLAGLGRETIEERLESAGRFATGNQHE